MPLVTRYTVRVIVTSEQTYEVYATEEKDAMRQAREMLMDSLDSETIKHTYDYEIEAEDRPTFQ